MLAYLLWSSSLFHENQDLVRSLLFSIQFTIFFTSRQADGSRSLVTRSEWSSLTFFLAIFVNRSMAWYRVTRCRARYVFTALSLVLIVWADIQLQIRNQRTILHKLTCSPTFSDQVHFSLKTKISSDLSYFRSSSQYSSRADKLMGLDHSWHALNGLLSLSFSLFSSIDRLPAYEWPDVVQDMFLLLSLSFWSFEQTSSYRFGISERFCINWHARLPSLIKFTFPWKPRSRPISLIFDPVHNILHEQTSWWV